MADQVKDKDIIEAKAAPVVIHAQYLKDISFENPNAPHTLRAGKAGPEMDVNINLGAKEIEDDNAKDLYEVTLIMSATAKKDDTTYFLVEIQYGALVSLAGLPEKQHHPMLFIEVPRMMFPFARQILADMTAQGGYPPLLLNPVDFQAMYLDRFADELKSNEEITPKKNGAAV